MDFFVCDEVEIENQIPVIEHDFRETKSQLFAQTERQCCRYSRSIIAIFTYLAHS